MAGYRCIYTQDRVRPSSPHKSVQRFTFSKTVDIVSVKLIYHTTKEGFNVYIPMIAMISNVIINLQSIKDA